jgi:hypothetical protein
MIDNEYIVSNAEEPIAELPEVILLAQEPLI